MLIKHIEGSDLAWAESMNEIQMPAQGSHGQELHTAKSASEGTLVSLWRSWPIPSLLQCNVKDLCGLLQWLNLVPMQDICDIKSKLSLSFTLNGQEALMS